MTSFSTKIIKAEVDFKEQPFAKPLIISSGEISGLTIAEARVVVRVNGVEAVGRGNIFLSDLWAWPDAGLNHLECDHKLRTLCRAIAAELLALCGGRSAHPLALGLRLHKAVCEGDNTFSVSSALARAMVCSPFDAAIHDAVGHALQCGAFDFYSGRERIAEADPWLKGDALKSIREMLAQPPRLSFPAWWLIGQHDNLADFIRDPVCLRHYHCFKLKLLARDNAEDADRTCEVFQVLKKAGVKKPRLTVDSNEANPDADSVLDYLERLRDKNAEAFAALEYLEQPTGRDISLHCFNWKPVAAVKPVLLDEGLTSLDLLPEIKAQGWSGLALKTCKGHSFALVAAAWAR